MDKFTFHTLNHPHDHFIRSLRTALTQHDETVTEQIKTKHLGICVNDSSGGTVAAIYGWIQWGWLYIDSLWVDKNFQNQGIGKRLLLQLEHAALEQGINRAYLDTGCFQAPDFYKKNGYETYAQMDVTADDGKHYTKYTMRKPSIQDWQQKQRN